MGRPVPVIVLKLAPPLKKSEKRPVSKPSLETIKTILPGVNALVS
jgi:hypothetical protein